MKLKNRKKVKKIKSKLYFAVAIIIVLIILLLWFLCAKLFAKDYYSIESRLDRVKTSEKIDNSGYSTVGWLRVQGTDLDLPIVYSSDFYEAFPMQMEEFVWLNDEDTKFHNMIRVEGHNLYNLSASPKLKSNNFHRFEQLMSFIYYDFAKDNKYIQLTIDGKEYIYKIFFAGFIPNSEITSYSIPLGDYNETDMKDWLNILDKYNLYKYNVNVNEKDNMVSLSTCTRFFGKGEDVSFYVNGRLLRDGEKINNYKVTKSDTYKDVEEVLKGDESNEKDAL